MRKTLLLVEDDRWLADLYSDVLTEADFTIHHASSAEEGLALLDEHSDIACIILDIFLPSHSGIEFLHECASYADTSSIPIVILSSVLPQDLGMSKQRWQQYGVSAHLYKPITKPAMLVQTVTQVMSKQESELSA